MSVTRYTLEEWRAAIKAQGAPKIELVCFKCPMCKTIQCAADLIAAGAGADLDDVEGYLGFSCVGRFSGAGASRKKPDGKPCDWTLGGLFQLHETEVELPDGSVYPRFALATPGEAAAHIARVKARDVEQCADREHRASPEAP